MLLIGLFFGVIIGGIISIPLAHFMVYRKGRQMGCDFCTKEIDSFLK